MKQVRASIALLAVCLAVLSACGGGGHSSPPAHQFTSDASNVVPITVAPGAGDANSQTFNIPLVTVTVCGASGSPCVNIPNVLVDTGSSGLRLMASVLTNAGLTLSPMADPAKPATNTIHECLPFADGYSWGAVSTAVVKIGGETTGSAIPVQVIDDSSSPNPAAPNNPADPTCVKGVAMNSANAFDANGVLGLATFNQDCGSGCVTGSSTGPYGVYWSCSTATGTCSATDLPLAAQVANPVASFPTDNNGVVVQLQEIPATGATTASGYLVFGIGTQSNNGLNGATVITADAAGNFTTTFNGQPLITGFIDSGSNALFFTDSSLQKCSSSQYFYCPPSPVSLSATNQGTNGTMSTVSFQVANLTNIPDTDFAINDVAGPAQSIGNYGSDYFDWGLPFFYNRTVFVAIEGMSAGGTQGPYYAY
jgi:hypothetical protein